MIARPLAVVCLALVFGCAPAAAQVTAPPSPAALEDALRQLLTENPQILLDALRQDPEALFDIVRKGVRRKQARAEEARIAGQIETPLEPVIEPDRPMRGAADAPATIVVYSDFLCHFCGVAAHTLGELESRHEGTIRLVYKHCPLSETGRRAALYFEALARQDPARAWQFYDEAFMRQDEIREEGDAALANIARGVGGDMERLATDLDAPQLTARIEADMAEAERFGFDGTPVAVINGVALPGARALAVYEQVLARTLARDRPTVPPDTP